MPKISALNTSATVNLEIGGQKCGCKWLAYNHYGSGEVALLLGSIASPIVLPAGSYLSGDAVVSVTHYFGSSIDNFTFLGIEPMMSESLRKSLIPVSISDGVMTMRRSIFVPSTTEVGQSSVTIRDNTYGSGSYPTLSYTGSGTRITPLSSLMTHGVMRGRVVSSKSISVENNSYTYTMDVDSYFPRRVTNSTLYANYSSYTKNIILNVSSSVNSESVFVDGPPGGIGYIRTDVGSNTSSIINPGSAGPYIVLLDGNVECAYSSGGDITKPAVVETYRKINGVWYRTV